jgi:hypothetical protein
VNVHNLAAHRKADTPSGPLRVRTLPAPVAASGTALRSRQSSSCPGNQVLCDPTWIGIKRDLLDDALVPLNADLDQNNDPEVAQRGRNLDA